MRAAAEIRKAAETLTDLANAEHVAMLGPDAVQAMADLLDNLACDAAALELDGSTQDIAVAVARAINGSAS